MTEQPAVPSAWPSLIALAAVVLLSVGMLVVDLVLDRSTAATTSELVDNSLRSVALADDLRYQAYRLSIANLGPDQIASIAEQIDVDARAYALLATNNPDESREWDRLQALLAHLRHEQPLPAIGSSATLTSEIETAISRLVEINRAEAERFSREIADAHRSGLVADASVLAITLALAAIVAVALLRALRRQRELVRAQVTSLDERARELAAFASRTAHDLKGPLSPVRGYADLLSIHDSADVREVARRISRAAERMQGVIEDLLALSVHGKLQPGRAGVTPIVLELLDELRDQLGDVELAVDTGDHATASSPGILGQILRNLLTNAAKYRAPDRRLVLRVEARRVGDAIEIAVIDNGIGMDGETRAHAFEPLYRAPGASTPGHGIGLAIVQRTLEALGGSVELASTPGTGTRVTVRMPAA